MSTRNRCLLAMVAGLLLAISFPKFGIAGFAWIAPALMLLAALGTRGGETFRIGYVAGLAQYLASVCWLLFIPYRWHSIPIGPLAGWVALCAYLALYPATWVWLAMRISNFKFQISNSDGSRRIRFRPVEEISSWNWSGRMFWALSCAATWVALEMVLTRLFGGFPWNLLGVSQQRIVPLAQVASLAGVYGVSFLVAWSSVSLLCAGIVIVGRPQRTSAWIAEVMPPFAAVVVLFVFGFHRLAGAPAGGRELNVTLVQPSIPQTLIWNPEKDEERFHELIRLCETALTNQTDLLIWPESAIPKMLRYDRGTFQAVTNLAVRHHVWMIVGSDDAEPSGHSASPKDVDYYNCSFFVSPAGQLEGRYRKRNLVIFGEYIPLQRWLPFLKWFTPIQGGFTPGNGAAQFELPDLDVRTSVLICFEDVFPQLARDSARNGTDFLVNITNDGWFGEGAAQWQHAVNAGFRAIENGLPLLRCTNTGLTCWFDSFGRLRGFFRDANGSVYGAGFMVAKIPLLRAGEKRAPTFYHQHGDWFGWGCVAVAGLALVRTRVSLLSEAFLKYV